MNDFEIIVKDILNNDDFKKLETIKHHKGSRLEHSLQVAKKSYEIAKTHNLDYVACARAGLLHDFFSTTYSKNLIKKISLLFNHGNIAKENSKQFGLTEKEANIIASHMFPLSLEMPKSKEAILVSLVDKTSASHEICSSIRYKHATLLIAIFLMLKKGI